MLCIFQTEDKRTHLALEGTRRLQRLVRRIFRLESALFWTIFTFAFSWLAILDLPIGTESLYAKKRLRFGRVP
ncbi:hypothetical protein L596_000426 [Steinernema carpocapsae]|uniref:Uncharacterized protein n=1 Tax=Steinernema carpocapsae TaxID=34508 RepID=A0A4U8UKE6_STECR|nr:hypothetical protein L596_000426 [Steinernema carpocapsae]